MIKDVIIQSVKWVIRMIFFNRFPPCKSLLRECCCNHKLILASFSHLHPSKPISLDLLKLIRSNHPDVFFKKVVRKSFAKFTGKHLRWSLFFNKVAGKRLWHSKICKNFIIIFFYGTPPMTASESICSCEDS